MSDETQANEAQVKAQEDAQRVSEAAAVEELERFNEEAAFIEAVRMADRLTSEVYPYERRKYERTRFAFVAWVQDMAAREARDVRRAKQDELAALLRDGAGRPVTLTPETAADLADILEKGSV